jgi:hypothetical protein
VISPLQCVERMLSIRLWKRQMSVATWPWLGPTASSTILWAEDLSITIKTSKSTSDLSKIVLPWIRRIRTIASDSRKKGHPARQRTCMGMITIMHERIVEGDLVFNVFSRDAGACLQQICIRLRPSRQLRVWHGYHLVHVIARDDAHRLATTLCRFMHMCRHLQHFRSSLPYQSFPPRRLVTPTHAQVRGQVATAHHTISPVCRIVVEYF